MARWQYQSEGHSRNGGAIQTKGAAQKACELLRKTQTGKPDHSHNGGTGGPLQRKGTLSGKGQSLQHSGGVRFMPENVGAASVGGCSLTDVKAVDVEILAWIVATSER